MANIRKETRDGREAITVSGDVTVLHAAEIAAALREAVNAAAAVELVIGQVTAADVTFPQTVCAAHRTAASLDKRFDVRGQEKEPLGALLREAGFLRHVGCQDKTRKTCIWLLPE